MRTPCTSRRALDEALDLLAAHGDEDTHVIAGGTSMVLLMTMGLVQPEHVIALRKIPELHGITTEDDGGLEDRGARDPPPARAGARGARLRARA